MYNKSNIITLLSLNYLVSTHNNSRVIKNMIMFYGSFGIKSKNKNKQLTAVAVKLPLSALVVHKGTHTPVVVVGTAAVGSHPGDPVGSHLGDPVGNLHTGTAVVG